MNTILFNQQRTEIFEDFHFHTNRDVLIYHHGSMTSYFHLLPDFKIYYLVRYFLMPFGARKLSLSLSLSLSIINILCFLIDSEIY